MAEQLALDFTASVTQRHRRAKKAAEEAADQTTLFASWAPNLDIHLHSPSEAIAQISGSEPERAHHWLAGLVGNIRVIKPRRVAFATDKLDRLLHIRPPAQVTLDAASAAVARAIWANAHGLKPLHVRRERQRLLADSPRWPRGFRVKDAPWTAIATMVHLGFPLNVDENARALLHKRLEDAGAKIAVAGLAGSAVVIETTRPELVEAMGLPALAYAGEPGSGTYKMPLLKAEPLLRQHVIEVPEELRKAIEKATAPIKPMRPRHFTPAFPYKLYDFQADDAAKAVRILETTGGVLLAGDMGSGKFLRTDEPVRTPSGWVPIGDIAVGDQVFGSDGQPHTVTGVYPQGVLPLYRVTFTDGTQILAGAEHLWAVHSPAMKERGRPEKVLSTEQLLTSGLRDAAGNPRWYIPLVAPLQYPAVDLPLDPYLLGVLLGEGHLPRADPVTLTAVDPQILQGVRAVLPAGVHTVPVGDGNTWRLVVDRGRPDPLRRALADLGLLGHRAGEKHIPEVYLRAPVADRLALLQGLLDTGGGLASTPQAPSGIVFSTTSRALMEGLRELVESLGGTARTQTRLTTHTHDGESRTGRQSWRVCVALPQDIAPFRLARKADSYSPRPKPLPTRGIADITPVEPGEAVCISVDAPDNLYVTRGHVLTHNTTVSLGLADHMNIWPLLVVAPLSAFSTWQRQLGEMGKRAYLATESPAKSWQAIEHGDFEAVVITFDRLHAFVELIERMHFRGIIADEIQRIRTPGSKRSRALRALAASVPLRIGLSGTPLTNTVNDLLPLGAFLAPGEWRPRANEKDLEDMYPGDPIEAVAEHLGSLMVRRRIDQTGAPMPKRNDHRVYVQLTPEQRRALEELEQEAEKAKAEGEFDNPQGRFHAFAKLQKQRQIINSPATAGIRGPNPKVTAAIKLAKDFLAAGRKGVIFCADRATFTEIGQTLDREGIGWVGIWGSTPPAERISNEKKFHAGAPAPNGRPTDVVVCTIQAGAESWSASPTGTWLISTAYVYAPSTLSQMEARVHRLNSDLNGPDIEICYIHAQVPGGSLDDRMVEILETKKALFAQVVDRRTHTDNTAVHYSMGDLVYLLTGKRDARLDASEADRKAAVAAEQAKKRHAKTTLYKHKRGNADLIGDTGEQALTLEEYRDLDALLEASDHEEDFDLAPEDLLDDAAFDTEDGDD